MKTDQGRQRIGSYPAAIAGALLCLCVVPAAARNPPRPDSNQRLEQIKQRALRNREEVKAWARKRGLDVRHDDGRRVMEIKAIRNSRPLYYVTWNDDAAVSSGAAMVRGTAPFSVDGEGVAVGVWDGGGVMMDHQEFGGRIAYSNAVYGNYHATHVGGTICASGLVTRARGMAPAARIDSYDWVLDDYEMMTAAASTAGETNRISLSNHSYGILAGWFYAFWTNPWTRKSGYHWWGDIYADPADEYFGQYGADVRIWDEVVYERPYYLPFKAVGNERDDGPSDGDVVYYSPDNGETWTNAVYDSSVHPLGDGIYKSGYDTIPYLGNAKNIMTVGAVHDAVSNDVRHISGATNTVFTSWGPADDGRIKPDIVANGFGLYSCNVVSTSSYAIRSGSSMSAPNACGSAVLLVDYYDDLFPGDAMRASTLKGLILHTADDLGRPGPDYQFGWGLMNTHAAALLLKEYADGNMIALTEASLISSNSVDTYTGFSDSGGPVRVTLCWTDPPGPARSGHDDRSAALVHDLDLKVTGPDGRTYYPFTLSYSDPEADAATDTENRVDNVEQILIPAPAVGHYTVTVDCDGPMQDGMQHYSLLVSGLVSDEDEDGLPDYWEYGYFDTMTGGMTAADADGDGMDNLSEYIAGSSPIDPDSVFRITSGHSPSSTGSPPFVITWDGVPGRIYSVYRFHNLYFPYEHVASGIDWTVSSYTDTVQQAGDESFYRIDVRIED